jgi:hypothetical protein
MHTHRCRLDHPRRNRRWVSRSRFAGGVRKSGGRRRFNLRWPCAASGKASLVWRGSLPASSRKGRGLSQASYAEQADEGSGGCRNGAGWKHPHRRRREEARIGSLGVVLARSLSRSRNRQLVVWRKEAGALGSKRVASVRGRASSVRPVGRKHEGSGAKGHQGWVEAETVT